MPDLTSQVLPEIVNHRLPGLTLGDDLVMPHYEGLSLVNLPGTVTQLLGIPGFGQPPLVDTITDSLDGPYQKVVLLLVDALGFQFFKEKLNTDRDLVWSRYFDSAVFSPITSICPSTTASALTTLWTGVGAAAHGVIGYEMWAKEFGMVINNILHSPANAKNDVGGLSRAGFAPEVFMDKPLLGPHLREHGIKPTTFIHTSIAHSGLSLMQMRDVNLQTYVNEADLCVSLADYINNRQSKQSYIYIYYSDVDSLMHRYDVVDERVGLQFGAFSALFDEGFLKRLSPAIARETLLVLTADHGSIATPRYERYDLGNHPQLMSYLVMQPTCEHRLPILFIKPGKVGAVRDYFAKTWPNDFILVDPEAALENGLFGQGPFAAGVRDRLGDLIVVTKGDAYLWWSPKPNHMAGRHGGLSPGEMLAPFYALPLKHLL
jgi:hypothetical protein